MNKTTKRILLFWSIVLVGILFVIDNAHSQKFCLPHKEFVVKTKQFYNQELKELGTTNEGQNVIELFISENSSTWTIIMTDTRGISCIMKAGTDWFEIAKPKIDEPGM